MDKVLAQKVPESVTGKSNFKLRTTFKVQKGSKESVLDICEYNFLIESELNSCALGVREIFCLILEKTRLLYFYRIEVY